MDSRNAGVTADPLFVGLTRPPMRFGVTYAVILCNVALTMEVFLLTKNLLVLLLAVPVHGVCMLLCARDARFFDLVLLWGRARIPAVLGTLRYWRSSSCGPWRSIAPNARGIRRGVIEVRL